MPRKIIPIKQAAPYIGARSTSSVYELIKTDPAFAALWFKVLGRTVAFEDRLIAYTEDRAENARLFVPASGTRRKRGRPPRPQPETVAAE